jgi:hypothetical protein
MPYFGELAIHREERGARLGLPRAERAEAFALLRGHVGLTLRVQLGKPRP